MFANVHIIDLKDIYGEKWEGCQFRFTPLPYRALVTLDQKDQSEQATFLADILVENFIDGEAIDLNGEKKEVTKKDFEKYFLEPRFINKAPAIMMDTSEGLSQDSEEQ